MSGESAQDIEVSITAPNRSFHATVIASDVSWQDRPFGTVAAAAAADQSSQARRPIWSSAFGDSIDTVDTMDSESYDPMVNSTTSLSQDSLYDGIAVEFVSSTKDVHEYINGVAATGMGLESAAPAAAAAAAPESAAAAFTSPTAASDAVSTSIEMRPVGFAETDRGSISCEMMTSKPVLVGNGHLPTGDTTVTSSSTYATVTEATVTSSGDAAPITSTVTSSSTTVTSSSGESATTVTSSSATVTEDSEMTTHVPMAPGSTFQMAPMEAHEEHAVAPDTPRDRAMSLHERSLLAHDLHTLASTMDTIRDEDEEVKVGSSSDEEKQEKRTEESYTVDRRVSLTGVPISATTYHASSQPTIFEVAETAAAAVAAAAEAAAPAAAGGTVAAPADEPSPYLKKLLDAQEATRQLMALLGESTQMLGLLPTAKHEDEKEKSDAEAAAEGAATAATETSAAAETSSSTSFVSQSSSSMTSSSSAFSSSTSGLTVESAGAGEPPLTPTTAAASKVSLAAPTEIAAADAEASHTAASAAAGLGADSTTPSPASIAAATPPATPATPSSPAADSQATVVPASPTAAAAAATAVPATPTELAPPATPTAGGPPSPALEISARPMDITFDDGTTVQPAADAAAAASTDIPISVWQQAEEKKAEDAAPVSPKSEETAAAPIPAAAAATEIPVTVWQPEVEAADKTQTAGAPSAESEAAAPTDAARPTEIPVTVWQPEVDTAADKPQTPAAPSFSISAPAGDGTQNASIVSALENLAANMTTVTTKDAEFTEGTQNESICNALESLTTVTTTNTESSTTVTTTAPITLGTPVQLQPSASPTTSLSEPMSPAGDRPVTPTPASTMYELTISSLAVDLPTPRLTPEPDQERFVTNNEQTEATMTKSSFSFESSTQSSSTTETGSAAAAGAASTTDYILPTTTSIVLTETDEPATPAAAPAAPAAPTITPVAVDAPDEIVRHLDDAAAWAAPVGAADSAAHAGAAAIPISIVPAAGGPPPLAREPREKTPEAAAAVPEPQGPPKLARESEEHHEFSRSVMVERRVLSPDSGAPQHTQPPAAAESSQAQATAATQESSFSSTQVTSSSITTDSTEAQQSTGAAVTTETPVTISQQPDQKPAADAVQTPTTEAAPTEIPVTITAVDAAPAPAAPAAAAADDAPLSVVLQPALSQQQQKPETETPKDEGAIDIPVIVQQSSEPAKDAAESAAVSIPVSVQLESMTQPAAASASTEIPVTVAKQPETESNVAETPSVVQQKAVLACELKEKPEETASTDIPVTVSQQSEQPTDTVAQQQQQQQEPAAAAAAAAPEVPVANAMQQEQQAAAAAPAADAAAITSGTPTTAHAPMSLESTFQITPQDEDFAQPPTMLRDRAMSLHERSLLAHESSGFQPGLEPLPENDDANGNGEVHVANAEALDQARRRASVAPGADGEAAIAAFQMPSTSCLFTVDEARDESETPAPASTASPSESAESTTIASSIIDVTAPEAAAAAKPPQSPPGGVKWLTESECGAPAQEHSLTPDSPQSVVAAAPQTKQPETDETPAVQQQEPVLACELTEKPQEPAADTAAAPMDTAPAVSPAADAAQPANSETVTAVSPAPAAEAAPTATSASAVPASPAADVAKPATSEPAVPASPAADAAEPVTLETEATTTAADAAPAVTSESAAAATAPAVDAAPIVSSETAAAPEAPPPTPKTLTGVSWVTEPATTTTTTTTEPAQSAPEIQAPPPQTPKTPQGDGWITEPAAAEPAFQLKPTPVEIECVSAGPASPVPETPKSQGVTWISEPATTAPAQPATEDQAPPQTPKTPTDVAWIAEPAAPAATAAAATTEPAQPVPVSEAPPQTPKTPTGVSWITEPAASGAPDVAPVAHVAAATAAPSFIDITAPPELAGQLGGAGALPKSPTSPGIKWASDSTRIGGNVEAAGAPPAPDESTFVVNAPWEGTDAQAAAPVAPAASAPDADGVTWITEAPKETAESAPRPPLTRSESTRSERDPSTATDITVREATPQRRTLVPSTGGEEENLANGVMQEGQGTKVRKLSWADQQQSGAEDSFSAAIDDYEKKLNETTEQTRALVDLLCKTGGQITENSMKMSDVFSDAVQASVRSMMDQERKDRAPAALSPIAENGEPMSREPPPQLIAGALPPNVESVIVSCPELKYVTGSLVLDNANILVTDEESGLFLFTLDSKVVRHVTNPLWKRASSPAIFKDRLKAYIIILMDCKDEEDGSWVRHIVKFTENLDYVEKVECPKWIRDRTILSDRLAVNRYENIYYCANGEIFSGLYELAPTGKWTELLYRQSESFIDMLAFAIIGPIQQILIVEGRRDHVLLCSIRESVCVDSKRMGICERPGALAKDESGRLFVMNRAQAAVQIVDTRVWAACRNMALVDKFVPHFSASFGMLVIPQKRAVKVHKYSFEWDD